MEQLKDCLIELKALHLLNDKGKNLLDALNPEGAGTSLTSKLRRGAQAKLSRPSPDDNPEVVKAGIENRHFDFGTTDD